MHHCKAPGNKICCKRTWAWPKAKKNNQRRQQGSPGLCQGYHCGAGLFWSWFVKEDRSLHRGGLWGHRPRKTPLLKQRHINARLKFAHEHLKYGNKFWKSVLLMRLNVSCLGTGRLLLFGVVKEKPLTIKTQLPLLNMVEGAVCCVTVVLSANWYFPNCQENDNAMSAFVKSTPL